MTLVGGPKAVTDLVRAQGGQPGPRSIWLGSWVLRSGYNQFKPFFEACKADGVEPLVKHWWMGDDNSIRAIQSGVQDKHQGVWKTAAMGVEAAKRVAAIAKEVGIKPLFTIELEWNKGDVTTAAGLPIIADYLEDVRKAIKQAHPEARCIYSPGAWGDLKALAQGTKAHASACDLLGLQVLKFPPRHSRTDYLGSVDHLARSFATLRSIIPDKPAIIYDCAWSTYAGGSSSHPFDGGDGKAYDAEQKQVYERLFELLPGMDVEAVVLRNLTDSPTFAVSNYGGHAERHLGLVRADGTKKPAYDVLVALASPPVVPEPPVDSDPTGALEALEARIDGLGETIDTLDNVLGEMGVALVSLRARTDAMEKRLRDAGLILKGE